MESTVDGRQVRSSVALVLGVAVVSAASLLALLWWKAEPAQATFPGQNGNITFEGRGEQGTDIFSIRPDGTGLSQLTTTVGFNEYNPSYSADGSSILFDTDRDGNQEIYRMGSTGGNEGRVTTDREYSWTFDGEPAFSPDGSEYVFARINDKGQSGSDRDIDIHTKGPNGTSRVVHVDGRDGQPSFSPDGSKILFHSEFDGGTVYVVNSDGTGLKPLASGTNPSFSPDGSLVAYERYGRVFLMNADGSHQQPITDGRQPAFSPDCARIAYVDNTFVEDPSGEGGWSTTGIYTKNLAGEDRQTVTAGPDTVAQPDWQPLGGAGAVDCPALSPPPPTPQLSIADASVTEGDAGTRDATFSVTLLDPSRDTVTVNYETIDGTATQPDDYEWTVDTLTFGPGETTKTVAVPVKGDTADEADEDFSVQLWGVQNAEVADGTGRGTIVDDDAAPPAPPSDGDGDGVPDDRDNCPGVGTRYEGDVDWDGDSQYEAGDERSLREAIRQAAETPGPDWIDIHPIYGQIIDLTSGPVEINDPGGLTINGNGGTVTQKGPGAAFQIMGSSRNIVINELEITGAQSGGAGIGNFGGEVWLINSTVHGNSSEAGGIYNAGGAGGGMFVINSTVSCNGTYGIVNEGSLLVYSSTIADNGLGISNTAGFGSTVGSSTVGFSIVAGNGYRDVEGSFSTQGHNLIGKGDGSTGLTDGIANDRVGTGANPIDPGLRPLGFAETGPDLPLPRGSTPTHPLRVNSPAVDAAGTANGSCELSLSVPFDTQFQPLKKDQRGVARPWGPACDIGAFERAPRPVDAENDAYTTEKNTPLTVGAPGVLANDYDYGVNAVVAQPRPASGPSHGTLALDANGSFTYTPNAGFTGEDSFTYKASHGGLLTSQAATVTITVEAGDDTPPQLNLPANITGVEATGPGGAPVTFGVSATDEEPASPQVTCSKNSGDTFPIGTTTVTCSATDAAGNTANGSFDVTVRDTTAPTLSGMPQDITAKATSPSGATVNYAAPTATDKVDGTVPVGCTPASGGTFAIGTTTVSCSAEDSRANKATQTFRVSVVYDFGNGSGGGFAEPVTDSAMNQVKGGAGVPVKFGLGGNFGLDIFDAGYPLSRKISCSTQAPIDPIEQTTAVSTSGLKYDAASGKYIYSWKTEKAWSNTCRQLVIKLKDGTEHKVNFEFK
jgi:VCBS repeat-containing protein